MTEEQFLEEIKTIGKALNETRNAITFMANFSVFMGWLAATLLVLNFFIPQFQIATNTALGVCTALAWFHGYSDKMRTTFEKDMAWFQMMYHAYKDFKDPEEKKHLINSTIPLLEKMEEWL